MYALIADNMLWWIYMSTAKFQYYMNESKTNLDILYIKFTLNQRDYPSYYGTLTGLVHGFKRMMAGFQKHTVLEKSLAFIWVSSLSASPSVLVTFLLLWCNTMIKATDRKKGLGWKGLQF